MPDISIIIPTSAKTLDNGSTDTMEVTYKTVRAIFRLTGTRFDWHVIQQRAWPARQKEHPMEKRLPASMRTREELRSLIEGRLSPASAKDELVKLATRLIIEEGLEGEAGDAVGRDYYEHGAPAGQGYRNGYRTGRLKTAEGAIEYSAPQVAGREEPYRSAIREHLKGHTRALEEPGDRDAGARAFGPRHRGCLQG
jgi:hypothetical protein